MKRNSYERLRKVVMAGWFVGFFWCVFLVIFFFPFLFLTVSFKLKHSQIFGGRASS